MDQYIHHIPGKLQIKNPRFINNTVILDEVTTFFESCSGIEYVTANPLTGSLVVNYDATVVDPNTLLEILRKARIDP
jgi:hypothetical protein